MRQSACALILLCGFSQPATAGTSSLTQAESAIWPTGGWQIASPEDVGMDPALLAEARDYALAGDGSGMVTRSGKQVMAWGDLARLYDLKSTTKSIGATVVGLALEDEVLRLEDVARHHLPGIGIPPDENAGTGWLADITIRDLMTHTAGFDKPGGYTELLFAPGSAWSYSDGGTNWLADVLTARYRTDLRDLLFGRVLSRMGVQQADLSWRNHAYRERKLDGVTRREFGSGIHANVDTMARIGYLYLRRGKWEGDRILPAAFVDAASRPVAQIAGLPVLDPGAYPNASDRYGLLWWTNGDRTLPDVPADAYWSWGLFDSLILVIPSLDIVASRAGDGWRRGWDADYSVLDPFLTPIALSVQTSGNEPPRVDVITVTPDMVTLAPGAIRQFSAAGTDQYGDPIAVDAMWTGTGGSVDADGEYVAGSVAGNFAVTATSGGASGHASVVIEAAGAGGDGGTPPAGNGNSDGGGGGTPAIFLLALFVVREFSRTEAGLMAAQRILNASGFRSWRARSL